VTTTPTGLLTTGEQQRLAFLREVVLAAAEYLEQTDQRLFAPPPSVAQLAALRQHPDLSERIDAYVARLSRLLPALLAASAEPVGSTLDNLARAERLGWLTDALGWLTLRRLCNRLVHEYIRDPALLHEALLETHASVALLVVNARRMAGEAARLLGMAEGEGDRP